MKETDELSQYAPYKGLHKDPVRLVVVIGSFLLFLGVLIFYFSVVPFHFFPIFYGVLLAALLILLEGLTISILITEYKNLKQEKKWYARYSAFLVQHQIQNNKQKQHILYMVKKNAFHFRHVEAGTIRHQKKFQEMANSCSLYREPKTLVTFANKLDNLQEKVKKEKLLNEKERHVVNLAILNQLKDKPVDKFL